MRHAQQRRRKRQAKNWRRQIAKMPWRLPLQTLRQMEPFSPLYPKCGINGEGWSIGVFVEDWMRKYQPIKITDGAVQTYIVTTPFSDIPSGVSSLVWSDSGGHMARRCYVFKRP